MPSYPRPHVMVQVLAERAEDFILQSYKIRDVPLKLRPVSSERSRREPAERHGVVYVFSRHHLSASPSTTYHIAMRLLPFLADIAGNRRLARDLDPDARRARPRTVARTPAER